jgi:hypothetical protein
MGVPTDTNMTFQKKRKFCKSVLWLLLVAAVCLPLGAQVQFSGQITTNSSAPVTLANPANYTEQVTAVGVSSTWVVPLLWFAFGLLVFAGHGIWGPLSFGAASNVAAE